MENIIIETCHSRWIFDPGHQRFRRVPKGPGLERLMVTTDWRRYAELLIDPDTDSFVVVLNSSGTRMLRSGRHTAVVCPQCGAWPTVTLPVDAMAS